MNLPRDCKHCYACLTGIKYISRVCCIGNQNNPSYSTSCLDAHPLEFFFGNVFVVGLPMCIFKGSEIATLIWVGYAMFNTIWGHTVEGEHKIHHKGRFRYNYGAAPFFIFDRMLGTYKTD